MVDVLLTHSYHLGYDAKQFAKMQPYRPLGTLYAASALQQAGFSIALFDTMLRDPREFKAFLDETRPRLVAIYEDDFHFITKMCLSRMREVVWEFTDAASAAGIPVVVHGSDASDHPELFFERGVDYLLRGEAEAALVQLSEALLHGGTIQHIPGLYQRDRSIQCSSPTIRPLTNTQWIHIPPPSLSLTDFAPYRNAWVTTHGYFSVNMVASRGCPFRCNWCAKPISGNKFQLRSPDDVAKEMLQLKTIAGAEHIWFSDDVFALNQRWTNEFVHAVVARDAVLPFKIQSRADLMTEETISALKTAGCNEVWMGIESGSQKVLDLMDKGLDLSTVKAAREGLKQAGIRACYFLQLGYPGEEWADLQKTVSLVRETRPDDIGVSFSYPLPGTSFYAKVQAQLGAKQNWQESDDLCILFHGEYSTEFYRAVRDALHAEVDSWSEPSASAAIRISQLWQQIENMEQSSRVAATVSLFPQHHFIALDTLISKVGV